METAETLVQELQSKGKPLLAHHLNFDHHSDLQLLVSLVANILYSCHHLPSCCNDRSSIVAAV